jgi:2-dehydropantoate 2-reductase
VEGETWPRVAVLGAGAVGCYFGGMLARAGAPVTLIGRPHHVEAVARDGLWLEGMRFQERVRVAASPAAEMARDAAVVLLCVKTLDTEDAAKSLFPHLAPGAIVVSLQNGVDNVERIRAAAGLEAFPAVVYVAVAMTGPGRAPLRRYPGGEAGGGGGGGRGPAGRRLPAVAARPPSRPRGGRHPGQDRPAARGPTAREPDQPPTRASTATETG